MVEYFGTLGQDITTLLGNTVGRIIDIFAGILDTLARTVPGGLPVVVVLATIGVLVGLAALRR